MYDTAFHPGNLKDKTFVVTGGAGFIGSNLVSYLIQHDAGKVIVLDNLSTGYEQNIIEYSKLDNFEFHHCDINDFEFLHEIFSRADYVLHQAALGSVPRSLNDPLSTHASNATGFLSVLEAARKARIKRLIYASSSSVYGDSPYLPKVEDRIGNPKSPYAVTKLMDEAYAELYYRLYDMPVIGLRYFNIYGPRQNPEGPYAAAIPIFLLASLNGGRPVVYGDGEQSRDFTFVENAVQANIRAVFSDENTNGGIFNIACGDRYTLNEVLNIISEVSDRELDVQYKEERKGDIRDSHASIEKATKGLAYEVKVRLKEGIQKTWTWYKENPNYF